MFAMPPAIIRDFLAQLGEMLDRVERDVEQLHIMPGDAGVKDRISGALSAIGTGAGFLHLSGLVLAAASAASALHNLKGLTPASDAAALADLARAIGAMRTRQTELAKALHTNGPIKPLPIQAPEPEPERPMLPNVERHPLRLDEAKTPLVEFMVEDLRDAIALIEQAVDRLDAPAARPAGASELARIGLELARTARFFELDGLRLLADSMRCVGEAALRMSDETLAQAMPRVRGVVELLRELTDNLGYSTVINRPVDRVCRVLGNLSAGNGIDPSQLLPEGCTAMAALEIDGVIAPSEPGAAKLPETSPEFKAPDELPMALTSGPNAVPAAETREADESAVRRANEMAAAIEPREVPAVEAVTETPTARSDAERIPVEAEFDEVEVTPTINASEAPDVRSPEATTPTPPTAVMAARDNPRASEPEPKRLDAAIVELGNLITQSSRLAELPDELGPARESGRLATRVAHISADVTRATSDMKAAVLNARAVRVEALVSACADVVRLAMRRSGAGVSCRCAGGEIEIDMGVIDRLRGPVKDVVGEIAARAAAGSEVVIEARIDPATSNLDLTMAAAIDGTPTLAGPAVDELRTTVEAIRGTMHVAVSEKGAASVHLRVPTNLAFLSCTVVRIGGTLAAIPMSSVDEVVKPESGQVVGGQQSRAVLVRDGAAELLDGHALFGDATESKGTMPYAVVVSHAGRRVALSCTRAVGVQEVVVRPMDPMPRRLGPITGVGASSTGAAALIVDVPALVRMAADRPERLGLAA